MPGSDAEIGYRSRAEIGEDLERDPLVHAARLLAEAGIAEPSELLARYDAVAADVRRLADDAAKRPRLTSASEVMEPIAPTAAGSGRRGRGPGGEPGREGERVRREASRGRRPADAGRVDQRDAWPMRSRPGPSRWCSARTSAGREASTASPAGCSAASASLACSTRFSTSRRSSALALGCGVSGLLPVPEIQYLAYLHNAEDQLRGEAATLPFFSNGQYHNPMVLRIAGYGYQKGFGGHFHNDDAVAVLRDIPGIVVASPARPDDAAAMLRACLAAASVDGIDVRLPGADRALPHP